MKSNTHLALPSALTPVLFTGCREKADSVTNAGQADKKAGKPPGLVKVR
jgi:hypothetical protein